MSNLFKNFGTKSLAPNLGTRVSERVWTIFCMDRSSSIVFLRKMVYWFNSRLGYITLGVFRNGYIRFG